MSIVLIGGMDRLIREYVTTAEGFGVDLKVLTKLSKGMEEKIRYADGIIIFTNKVSHKAKNEAVKCAKNQNIPIFFCHSSGICALKNCLNCVLNEQLKKKN